MNDRDVDVNDSWAKGNAEINTTSIMPMTLTRLKPAACARFFRPVFNSTSDLVMTGNRGRSTFVGEDMPGVMGEVRATVAGGGHARPKRGILSELDSSTMYGVVDRVGRERIG